MKRFSAAIILIAFVTFAINFHEARTSPSEAAALGVAEICPESIDAQVRKSHLNRTDSTKLRRILVRIGDMAKAYCPWTEGHNPYDKIVDPLVSLEEFFNGNHDKGSIGPNLDIPSTPAEFYAFLRRIRLRRDVADVRILITQYDGPGNWPFSDTIFVITSAPIEKVKNWIPAKFKPDEIDVDTSESRHEAITVPAGMHAVTLWYD